MIRSVLTSDRIIRVIIRFFVSFCEVFESYGKVMLVTSWWGWHWVVGDILMWVTAICGWPYKKYDDKTTQSITIFGRKHRYSIFIKIYLVFHFHISAQVPFRWYSLSECTDGTGSNLIRSSLSQGHSLETVVRVTLAFACESLGPERMIHGKNRDIFGIIIFCLKRLWASSFFYNSFKIKVKCFIRFS